jgi:hypothetical protein
MKMIELKQNSKIIPAATPVAFTPANKNLNFTNQPNTSVILNQNCKF